MILCFDEVERRILEKVDRAKLVVTDGPCALGIAFSTDGPPKPDFVFFVGDGFTEKATDAIIGIVNRSFIPGDCVYEAQLNGAGWILFEEVRKK